MALFIQTYFRQNYSINEVVKQSIDVLFEAPVDTTQNDLYFMLNKAYTEQCSMFNNNGTFAVDGWGGWSSVMAQGELRCVEDLLDTVDDKEFELTVKGQHPKIGELAKIKGNGDEVGRIDGYFKRHVVAPLEETSPTNIIRNNLMNRMRAKRLENDPNAKYDILIVQCSRQNAEFVEVGTGIWPISMVEVVGLVGWDKRTILTNRIESENKDSYAPAGSLRINVKHMLVHCPEILI